MKKFGLRINMLSIVCLMVLALLLGGCVVEPGYYGGVTYSQPYPYHHNYYQGGGYYNHWRHY